MSHDAQQQVSPSAPDQSTIARKPTRFRPWMVLTLLAGVVLPLAAMVAELSFRFCSSIFFDPLPTGWHVALWSVIPLANLMVVITCVRISSALAKPAVLLIGIAIGTSFVYSVQFLPFLHFSLLAIIALGIGLGGISPFLAFATSLVCKRNLARLGLIDKRQHVRLVGSGIAVAVAFLGAFIFSGLATEHGLRMAASLDQKTAIRGVNLIRRFGNNLALLRACYELPSTAWAGFPRLENTSDPVRRKLARDTFYRVTGSTFTSMAPPKLFGPKSE